MLIFPKYIQGILVLITPLLITLTLIPLILKGAKKWKLFDHPDAHTEKTGGAPRKIHTQPTPRLGGVAMVTGFYISVALWSWPGELWKVFIPALVIFFIGLKDDFKHISPKIRLLLQLTISAVTVYGGGLEFQHLIFTPDLIVDIPFWAGFLLSIFVLTGSINAINMVDGLDGLAGGLVLISTTLLSYFYFLQTGNPFGFLMITLPLVGSIIGFLRYNSYPSRIFMGDGGSNWLGFMTGILILLVANGRGLEKLAVLGGMPGPENIHTPIISVLLCMAVPILDTGFVIITRLLQGKSPITPDKIHFHHGLLKIGLSHPNVVILIYFISILMGLIGYFPILFIKYSSWIIPYAVPAFLVLLLYMVMKLEENATEKIPLYQILFSKTKGEIASRFSRIFSIWQQVNQNLVLVILLAMPVFAGRQSVELGLGAGIVFLLVAVSNLFRFWENDFIDILIISVGAIVLLIANNAHYVKVILLHTTYNIHNIYNIIFIILGISTVLYLILTFKKQYLRTSPTDFLMIILPMLLLLAPDNYRQKYNLNLISLRSLVLFLALMTTFRHERHLIDRVRKVILFSLLYVFFTGFLGMKILY